MSCFHQNPEKTILSVPFYESVDNIEFYKVSVKVFHEKEWVVSRRYRDFEVLHEKLQNKTAIAVDLPGKKLIKSKEFLEKRRECLEKYLQAVAVSCRHSMPLDFVEFLELDKYDIVFLLQKLASQLSQRINSSTRLKRKFTILELSAISSRLRLPCPSFELQNSAFDFSHILDFCSQLESLVVVPSIGDFSSKEEYLQELISPIGTSNILSSTLTFDLSPFTHLTCLELCGIVPQNIENCDAVKATVTNLIVNNTRVQNVQQILLPDSIHGQSISLEQNWSKVKLADFGTNDIWQIDSSMQMLQNVETVHLNKNRLRNVTNLKSLYHLSHLNLSGNLIESVQNWNLELGNIGFLNLSGNKLKSLIHMSRLRSLQSLDLSWNEIEDLDEIDEISLLPIIESVSLNGNLLALEVDYRARVLSRFGDRCGEINLDNEKARPSEIDKAMVFYSMAALKKSKVG